MKLADCLIACLLVFCVSVSSLAAKTYEREPPNFLYQPTTADDEYERYKREGDELFRKGDYEKALKKYLACLEVPNFSNDTYAKGKIEQSKKALQLRRGGEAALNHQNGPEALEQFKQVLIINPEDPVTRQLIADYWEKEAYQKFTAGDFGAAKSRYEEALKFSNKKETLLALIQSCDDKRKQDKEPNSVEVPSEASKAVVTPAVVAPGRSRNGLRIGAATVGIASGLFAYSLNKKWQSALAALNAASQQNDPDKDGIILTQSAYADWKKASDAATKAHSKQSLFKVCLGMTAGAVLLETYLLLRKPAKPRKVALLPASESMGLALRLNL